MNPTPDTGHADDGSAPGASPQAARGSLPVKSKVLLAISVVILAAVGAIVVAAAGQRTPKQPSPRPARSFALPALGNPGREISLAGLAGRPVIINFFASWCAPCKRETPLLARFYRAEHGKVLVVGVDSNDGQANAMAFVRAEGVQYPVASDPAARVAVSYGVIALPQTFFLNAQHKIVRHVVGDVTQAELTSWARSVAKSAG
jgi:cytochrome c biogenesis protein CcmG, thiol:disulfide interchange protein DsbE